MRDENVTQVLVYRQEMHHQACRKEIREHMVAGDVVRYRNSQVFSSGTDCELCNKVVIYGDPDNTKMVPTNPAKNVLLAYQAFRDSDGYRAWAKDPKHGDGRELEIQVIVPARAPSRAVPVSKEDAEKIAAAQKEAAEAAESAQGQVDAANQEATDAKAEAAAAQDEVAELKRQLSAAKGAATKAANAAAKAATADTETPPKE